MGKPFCVFRGGVAIDLTLLRIHNAFESISVWSYVWLIQEMKASLSTGWGQEADRVQGISTV